MFDLNSTLKPDSLLDVLSSKIYNTNFECSSQTIFINQRTEEFFIDRAWGLEVNPSFSKSFCFAVFEDRNFYELAFLVEKYCVHDEMRNITAEDFFKKAKKQKQIGEKQYIVYHLAIPSNEWSNPILSELANIDLLITPDRSRSKDNLVLNHDGTSYRFEICLQNSQYIKLNLYDAKFYNLILACSKVAEYIASKTEEKTIIESIENWIKENNLC